MKLKCIITNYINITKWFKCGRNFFCVRIVIGLSVWYKDHFIHIVPEHLERARLIRGIHFGKEFGYLLAKEVDYVVL